MADIISADSIASLINFICGLRVMVASNLAEPHGGQTMTFKQAARRNIERYPIGACVRPWLDRCEFTAQDI